MEESSSLDSGQICSDMLVSAPSISFSCLRIAVGDADCFVDGAWLGGEVMIGLDGFGVVSLVTVVIGGGTFFNL